MATQRSATTQPPADSAVRAHTSAHLANSALLAQSDLSSLSSQQTLAAKPSLNSKSWTHTPSNLTLLWLCISLPLVIWDTSYVLLRPHSMPGGKYHYPLWAPYELYGRTDYVYGWKAWNEHNGFTAAQGWLNVVETVGYLCYLGLVFSFGVQSRGQGRGAPKGVGLWGWTRSVGGDAAGLATLVGFAASVMTLSKTVLYWLNEYHSGFENIGHNSIPDVFLLWIIPNGAWLILPSCMTYVFGSEILQGLSIASGDSRQTVSNTETDKTE